MGEVRALLTFADKGYEGVNNCNKSAYVIFKRPLKIQIIKLLKTYGCGYGKILGSMLNIMERRYK